MLVLFLPPLALIWETVIAIKKSVHFSILNIENLIRNAFRSILSFCVLLINEKNILFKESSIEHSYQVCFQLPQWFQRRRQHHFDTFGHLGLMFLLCTSIINILQNQPMAIPSKFGSYIYWSCSFFRRRLKTDNPLFDTFGFGLLASFEFF